jgi:hypothetical protein
MSTNLAGFPQGGNMPTQECRSKWAELSIQMSPFNPVITIDERSFLSWSRIDQQFILDSYQ